VATYLEHLHGLSQGTRRDFQKWKNKRYRLGMPRTASTEGNFENIEEIIRVDGRV
jgi:hypothetical protein